jgi:sulfhydrogenase subunit beta (sulfur reductase)
MKIIAIDKKQWTDGLNQLRQTYQLLGPVKEKDYFAFKTLSADESLDLSFQNTRLSPKSLIFPQSQAMLEYSLDESREDHHIMKEVAKMNDPMAVIGIRPCDAKAAALVKLNFDTKEYKDPYWLNLYHATTVVGFACNQPCSTCFCTTAGCGPFHEEGSDVLLVDIGEKYLAKVLTDKGDQLVNTAGWNAVSRKEEIIESHKKAAEAKITATIDTANLADLDTLTLHGADFWEDISFACINCGTCTFVCPTCWCFDIQDEVFGKSGLRMRNWDSCMFPIFTVHTTGHNPRGTKLARVRQRFMHKLKYFVDKYDAGIMCVGCGRCVRQCPVNIDIREVCDIMNNFGAADACKMQASG